MNGTAPRPRNALVALDLLRFAAAMMVLGHHYFGKWWVRLEYGLGPTTADQAMPTNAWLHSGWVGVEIFFVISGYVIAMSARTARAAEFAVKRFLRLWPAAFVCASLTAIVLAAGGVAPGEILPRWAASALLVPGVEQIDGVYWTLGIECAFYALVAILLWTRRWRPVPFALALSLWSLAYWSVAVGWTGLGNLVFNDPVANLSLGRYGALFALGVLVEAAHRKDSTLKSWMFVPALLAAPLCIAWHSATQRADDAAASVEWQPLVMFFIAFLVVVFAPAIQRAIRSDRLVRISIALGLATYPLYLLHHYVGGSILLYAAIKGIPPMIAVWPVIAAMVGLSLVVALKIEPTIRRGLRQLASRRRPRDKDQVAVLPQI